MVMFFLDVILFCCGDSSEEHLSFEPRLGVFVDLVELDDVANGGVTLIKTEETLRGAFFFSARVELKRKGDGGGRAGREMIDTRLCLLY